jgi:Meiotically up-regulated gene 113
VVAEHVYVISAEPEVVKIGLARDPARRLRGIQTGSYQKLELSYAFKCPEGKASAIERQAHLLLKDNRRAGEWFGVSVEQAKRAIAEATEIILNAPITPANKLIKNSVPQRPYPVRREGRLFQLPLRERWVKSGSAAILRAEDMELLKFCLMVAESQGIFRREREVAHVLKFDFVEAAQNAWPQIALADQFSRLAEVLVDYRDFGKLRVVGYRGFWYVGVVTRFWEESDFEDGKPRYCFDFYDDLIGAVRQTSIGTLLWAMVEQGAPTPLSGIQGLPPEVVLAQRRQWMGEDCPRLCGPSPCVGNLNEQAA